MKKKILIIYAKNASEIYNRKSALGSYIYSFADVLQELGNYEVSINGINFNKIQQSNLPSSVNQQTSFLKKIIPNFIKRILKDVRLFFELKKLRNNLFANVSEDLIIEFYSYASNIGAAISAKKNSPLIVIYDAPIIDEYVFFNESLPFFKSIISQREKKTLLQASTTVAYSSSVKNYIQHLADKKIEVAIHQNVDFSRFDFIENKNNTATINIGFIGSFLKWHRVDLLLSAFLKLKKEGYNVHLFLLGMGAEFENIKQLVENCNYKNDITMPGYADGEELLNYKKQIDIGVMPGSNWYGAPNKIFEYGASQMAVVAPNTPTIKDLFVNEDEVLLFENEVEQGLFTALKKLCEDANYRNRLATNLQQKIRITYSKNNTFEFYNSLIQKALK